MDKNLFKQYLCEYAVSFILQNWPCMFDLSGNLQDESIHLQQDNAPIHVKMDKFWKVIKIFDTIGIHIDIGYQPSNSLNLNILDLALFCSLQTYYLKN